MTKKAMNGCWMKLWAKCFLPADDFTGFNDVAIICKNIVRLSLLAGFIKT